MPVSPEWLHKKYHSEGWGLEEIAQECDVSHRTVRNWMDHHNINVDSISGAKSDGDITLLEDEEWLRSKYNQENLVLEEIADVSDTSISTVAKYMEDHGIDRRSISEAVSEGDIEKLQDREWLSEQYTEHERTIREISEETGISRGTVREWLEKHDIERRNPNAADGNVEPLRDEAWLYDQYINKERPMYDIANELDVSTPTVKRYMRKHGIETRSISEATTGVGYSDSTEKLRQEEWLKREYVEKGRSQLLIAEELGVNRKTVRRWLDNHDIERRDKSEYRAQGDVELLHNSSWVREQYVQKERSTIEIADELDVGQSTVARWLDEHGIEVRSPSERRAEGNVSRLHDESWVREQYLKNQRTIAGIADQLDVGRPTVKRYLERYGIEIRSGIQNPDHLDHIVRSTWELKIATLLSEAGIQYEYESIVFDYADNRTYTPDFVTSPYVIEVKGILIKEERIKAKAEAAMESLDDRAYVIVGTEVPCDIHIPWENHEEIIELFW